MDRYHAQRLVMDLCSDFEETEIDTDARGGYYKFYSNDPNDLAKKLQWKPSAISSTWPVPGNGPSPHLPIAAVAQVPEFLDDLRG